MTVLPIHPPNLPEAVDKSPWILLWIFASLSLMELYSLFSEPQYQIEARRFLFDGTLISFQTWIDYVATRLMVINFLSIFWVLLPFYRKEIKVFFWLSVGYLADYFVIYNNAVFKVGIIPISYTLFMIIIAGVNVFIGFKKSWRT